MARRHKKGHGEGGHENAERWLLTYADLITLLMVFFVVMYSMSQQDSNKFKQISAALQAAFNLNVLQGQMATSFGDGTPIAPPVDNLTVNNNDVPVVQQLQAKINTVLDGQTQSPDVTVGTDQDGVVIRLSGSYLFDSGRAELKPNSLAVLDAIAQELQTQPNDIRVEGHTDSIPLNSPRYASNWELSAARATTVVRYLIDTDHIQATRLMAAGFGEFHPIVPNDTREHRALNRRVEIHLLSTGFTSPPPSNATPSTGATEYLDQ